MEPSPDTKPEPASPDGLTPALWLPYTAPFVLFLLLTAVEGKLPKDVYPLAYMAKAALVTINLAICAKAWISEIRFDNKAIALGLVAGLIGLPLWLGVDAITFHLPKIFGAREEFNPFTAIPNTTLRMAFLGVRFYGLAIMVPLLEEVFWRSFLLRFVTDQDRWKSLPVGTFSWLAFAIVAVLFGAPHPEYLAGIVFAMLMAFLLRHTKSLIACIIAHGVTNLTLGIYIVATGNWKYW